MVHIFTLYEIWSQIPQTGNVFFNQKLRKGNFVKSINFTIWALSIIFIFEHMKQFGSYFYSNSVYSFHKMKLWLHILICSPEKKMIALHLWMKKKLSPFYGVKMVLPGEYKNMSAPHWDLYRLHTENESTNSDKIS